MSTVNVEELLVTLTEDQILERIIRNAEILGFPVTDWTEGSVARTFLKLFAKEMADLDQGTPLLARSNFIETAEPPAAGNTVGWLDLVGQSRFQETRKPASQTEGYFFMTTAPGVSINVSPGSLVFASGGVQFRSNETVTLSAGTSTYVKVIAVIASAAGNIPNNATITLVKQVAGLSATNPIYSGSSWITKQGQDQESPEVYRARCVAKWGSLSANGPAAAYIYWCQQADPLIRRVTIGPLIGAAFAFNVYVAGSSSTALPGATLTAAQDYIDLRKPQAAIPTVVQAASQALAITVTVRTTLNDTLITNTSVAAFVQAWIDALPIGGELIAGARKFWNFRLADAVKQMSPNIKLVVVTPGDTTIDIDKIVTASSIVATVTKE